MKAIISSFTNITDPTWTAEQRGIFDLMPPSSLRGFNDELYLSPDYATLLVCDQLIVDANSYDRLVTNRHWTFNKIAHLFKALQDEGFIQIEQFSARLQGSKSVIAERVAHDMATHDWNAELRESLEAWSSFIRALEQDIKVLHQHYVHWNRSDDYEDFGYFIHYLNQQAGNESCSLQSAEILSSENPSWVEEVLPAYLTYVHTNIELSRRFHAPIHDWSDYLPFYRRLAGHEQSQLTKAAGQADKLFSISFPEFEPTTNSHIMRILTDKRVVALRTMIDSAVQGDIVFDRDFAVATLREALATERKLARFRNITSYAAMPLGMVPVVGTPLSKAAEETAGAINDRVKRRPLDWFYLISDAADAEAVKA